ncbi:MAG: hypothetical protein R3C49_12940 [Planctomycetaceae bacterium]
MLTACHESAAQNAPITEERSGRPFPTDRMRCIDGKTATIICFVAATAATAVLISLFDGSLIAADSAQAFSVVRNTLAGHPLQTDLIIYSEHYRQGGPLVAQTVFPPGFPLLLLLPVTMGMSAKTAAFAWGAFSFWLIPQLIYRLGIRAALPPVAALAAGLSWMGFAANWANALMCLTDLTFIAVTLVSVLALCPDPRNNPPRQAGSSRLIAGGILASLAFLIRYAGVFWLPAAAFLIVHQTRSDLRLTVRRLLLFSAIPTAVVIGCFARNHQLVGSIEGGNNQKVAKPVIEVVRTVWYAVSQTLGLDHDAMLAGRLQEVLVVAGAAVLLTLVSWTVLRSGTRKNIPGGLADQNVMEAMALWAVSMTAGLLWLEKSASLSMTGRMLQPLIPSALLILAAIAVRIQIPSRVSLSVVSAATGVLGVGLMTAQLQIFQHALGPGLVFLQVTRAVNQAVETPEAKSLTARELLQGQRILAEQSQSLGEVLQQGTVGLTPFRYSRQAWSEAEVSDMVRRYRITRLVRFPKIIELPRSANPVFFEQLAEGQPLPAWLSVEVSTPDVVIYRVEPNSLPPIHIAEGTR